MSTKGNIKQEHFRGGSIVYNEWDQRRCRKQKWLLIIFLIYVNEILGSH